MLTSLHIEGNSLLHRLPVRVKLIALVASSIGLFLSASLAVQAIAFIVAAAIYLSVGLSPKEALKRVGFVFLTIFFLAAVNLFYLSVSEVATLTLRLMALVLFAAAVTATTTISAFMDEITVLLNPLERLGWLKAADVSLALGLVLRFVPDIFARYQAIREAHRARGLPVRPLTIIGPLIILTLKDADTIAAAIDARGFRRQ
ncbi:MAG: energy-coupling factor transporter transmembrane protein EcfT [Ensifer adhaerens]|nr:energy-coupling factor transporter transmembrane protein EcfT [Ensifer adhaerens]